MGRLTTALMLLAALLAADALHATETCPVNGIVIDRLTREGIPNASVAILGEEDLWITTDSLGYFTIHLPIHQKCSFTAIQQGWTSGSTDITVSRCTPFVRIELEKKRKTTSEKTIRRIVGMAEMMSKDARPQDSLYISYYADNLALIAHKDEIIHGDHLSRWSGIGTMEEDRHSNEERRPAQFMEMTSRNMSVVRSEYTHETQNRRTRECRKPNFRLRIEKKDDDLQQV